MSRRENTQDRRGLGRMQWCLQPRMQSAPTLRRGRRAAGNFWKNLEAEKANWLKQGISVSELSGGNQAESSGRLRMDVPG